jgi:hypothetical protein
MSALPAGREAWFEPRTVTSDLETGSSPALRVVRDRLVLGYRSGREVRIADWALMGPTGGYRFKGIQDGPDGFPLPAARWDERADEEESPEEPRPRTNSFGRGGPTTNDTDEP